MALDVNRASREPAKAADYLASQPFIGRRAIGAMYDRAAAADAWERVLKLFRERTRKQLSTTWWRLRCCRLGAPDILLLTL